MLNASHVSALTPCSLGRASRRRPTRRLRSLRSPASSGSDVSVEVKFCGLTRETDTAFAVALGASYVGVVFAESPRRVEPGNAGSVLTPARGRAKAVGVFGPASVESVAVAASAASLDVVQLHGDPSPGIVERVRPFFTGEVWAVVRIAGSEL